MGRAEDASLLNVVTGADAETLKVAFRQAARQCHPDLTGAGDGSDFVRLTAAYERLRDGHWDRVDAGVARPEKPQARRSSRQSGSQRPDFIDIFDSALGDVLNQEKSRRVLDHVELAIPFDYLLFGASLSFYVPVEMECRSCGGRGHLPDSAGVVSRCSTCLGDRVTERQLKVPVNLPPGLRTGQVITIPLDQAGLKGYDVLVELSLS